MDIDINNNINNINEINDYNVKEPMSFSVFDINGLNDDIDSNSNKAKLTKQNSNVNNYNMNAIDINDFNSYSKKDEYLIDCAICFDKYDMLDTKNAYLDCNCVIHSICFKEYVKNEINLKNIPILCPNHTCQKEINPKYIGKCLEFEKDLLIKYEKFSLNNYMEKNNKDVSCCPTPSCEYLFFFSHGDFNFFCPSCNNT